jgi:hypothetical protein
MRDVRSFGKPDEVSTIIRYRLYDEITTRQIDQKLGVFAAGIRYSGSSPCSAPLLSPGVKMVRALGPLGVIGSECPNRARSKKMFDSRQHHRLVRERQEHTIDTSAFGALFPRLPARAGVWLRDRVDFGAVE